MDADPGSGTDELTGAPVSARETGWGGSRPTVFGIVLLVVLALSALLRPGVADPSVMGLVWAGLAAAVGLGIVFPVVSVRLLRLEVVAAPTDLVVGQLATLEVRMRGRGTGLMLRCGRSPIYVIDLTSPATVKLPLEVSERGAYMFVPVEVSTDAPFSVMVARRQVLLRLPRQLLVGPEPSDVTAAVGEIAGDRLDAVSSGHSTTGDTVRSVRPYQIGDPLHMVHWPSTARTGSMVVRELEPPQTEGLAIVVNLGLTADETATGVDAPVGAVTRHDRVEAAASRAAGMAIDALGRGARVMLCTVQVGGPVVGEVANRLDVQRRLALATHGSTPNPPEGWPYQVVAP